MLSQDTVVATLVRNEGFVNRAADELKIQQRELHRCIRKYNLKSMISQLRRQRLTVDPQLVKCKICCDRPVTPDGEPELCDECEVAMTDFVDEWREKRSASAEQQKEIETMRPGKNRDDEFIWGIKRIRERGDEKWPATEEIGSPGTMVWLDKNILIVDDYQRDQEKQRNKIIKILKDFRWRAFGVLIVSNRDGLYYCVEGAGRLIAALHRDDVTMVPCIVHENNSYSGEAKDFIDIDRNRRPISPYDIFLNNLKAGYPNIVKLNRIIEQHGRSVARGSGPGTVACIKRIMDMANEDIHLFTKVWPLIAEVEDGSPILQEVVQAFWYIAKKKGIAVLENKRVRNKLRRKGHNEIVRSINSARVLHGNGGDLTCAEGLICLINKGRSQKIEL